MNYSIWYWVTLIQKLDPSTKLRPELFLDTIRMDMDIPKKLPAKKVNRLKLANKIHRHINMKAREIVDERINDSNK